MASLQDTNSPVAVGARSCMELLENLVKLSGDSDIVPKADVVDVLSRFKLWAGNMGALHPSAIKTSLDFRLRDNPKVSNRIAELLEELVDYIEDACSIASNERENLTWTLDSQDGSENEQGEDGEETSEIQEILKSMIDIIVNLFRFSAIIRDNSNRDRYAKAEAAAAMRHSLDDQFDIGHVRHKFPSLQSKGRDWLAVRLGKAITQRRKYLWYCREHHQKTQMGSQPAAPIIQESNIPAPSRSFQLDTRTVLSKPLSTLAPTQASTLLLTTDIPAEPEPEEDAQSQTSYATSVGQDEEGTKLQVVPLETVSNDLPNFECPYCWQIQTNKTEKTWRKHVLSDLKAYVCTFKDCDLPMFPDHHTWFLHELKDHRKKWKCHFCAEAKVFLSSDKYISHLKYHHSSLFIKEQLPAILEISQKSLGDRILPDCPFCEDWESRLRKINPDLEPSAEFFVTPSQFRHHVGAHMEQLALFAIPRARSDDRDLDSAKSEGHSINSLQNLRNFSSRALSSNGPSSFAGGVQSKKSDNVSVVDSEKPSPGAISPLPSYGESASTANKITPANENLRATTTIRGRSYDVTGLELDPEFLDSLPEEIREDVILATVEERHAAGIYDYDHLKTELEADLRRDYEEIVKCTEALTSYQIWTIKSRAGVLAGRSSRVTTKEHIAQLNVDGRLSLDQKIAMVQEVIPSFSQDDFLPSNSRGEFGVSILEIELDEEFETVDHHSHSPITVYVKQSPLPELDLPTLRKLMGSEQKPKRALKSFTFQGKEVTTDEGYRVALEESPGTEPPSYEHGARVVSAPSSPRSSSSRIDQQPILLENESSPHVEDRALPETTLASTQSEERALAQDEAYFPCEFSFLGCDEITSTHFLEDDMFEECVDKWALHCSSHFKPFPPPLRIGCPFCDQVFDTSSKPADVHINFRERIRHMISMHYMRNLMQGKELLDPHVLEYLWKRGVLDTEKYTNLRRQTDMRVTVIPHDLAEVLTRDSQNPSPESKERSDSEPSSPRSSSSYISQESELLEEQLSSQHEMPARSMKSLGKAAQQSGLGGDKALDLDAVSSSPVQVDIDYRKMLTTYLVFTVRKALPRSNKEDPTWARATVVQERLEQGEIAKQVKRLSEHNSRSLAEQKAALAPYQNGQVNKIFDDLLSNERDPDSFTFQLVGLDLKQRVIKKEEEGKRRWTETIQMSLYVARAPMKHVDCKKLYEAIYRIRDNKSLEPKDSQEKSEVGPLSNNADSDSDFDTQDEPKTLSEELARVQKSIPRVTWDHVNVDENVVKISVMGPWGEENREIYIRVTIVFSLDYPQTTSRVIFTIAKNQNIPNNVFQRLTNEVHHIASFYTSRRRRCLKPTLRYLQGDISFENATNSPQVLFLDPSMVQRLRAIPRVAAAPTMDPVETYRRGQMDAREELDRHSSRLPTMDLVEAYRRGQMDAKAELDGHYSPRVPPRPAVVQDPAPMRAVTYRPRHESFAEQPRYQYAQEPRYEPRYEPPVYRRLQLERRYREERYFERPGYPGPSIEANNKNDFTKAYAEKKVKVYQLRGLDWIEVGSGFCTGGSNANEVPYVVVQDDAQHTIFEAYIVTSSAFKKEQDTAIKWKDPSSDMEKTLSFQKSEECTEIWNHINHAQEQLLKSEETKEDVFQATPERRSFPPTEFDGQPFVERARKYILSWYSILVTQRKDRHAQQLNRINERARPHSSEIAAAETDLKRGMDDDWETSLHQYPDALETFYRFRHWDMRDPPLNEFGKGSGDDKVIFREQPHLASGKGVSHKVQDNKTDPETKLMRQLVAIQQQTGVQRIDYEKARKEFTDRKANEAAVITDTFPLVGQKHRVKVYELSGERRRERGIGYCTVYNTQEYPPQAHICVESEDTPKVKLFETRLGQPSRFWKEQNTVINWKDPITNVKVTLSFADAESCTQIWDNIRRFRDLPNERKDPANSLGEKTLPVRRTVSENANSVGDFDMFERQGDDKYNEEMSASSARGLGATRRELKARALGLYDEPLPDLSTCSTITSMSGSYNVGSTSRDNDQFSPGYQTAFGNMSLGEPDSASATYYPSPQYRTQNSRPTPQTIPWDMEVMKVPDFYDFIVEKGKEPYLRLHQRYHDYPSPLMPQIVYLDPIDDGSSNPCLYPGQGCWKSGPRPIFSRTADLERHYNAVHYGSAARLFPCDYPKCGRHNDPFTRKDHCRDHYKEFHKEDIGEFKGGKSAKDKARLEEKQQEWEAERKIDPDWWRCSKCLERIIVKKDGWNCPSCKRECNKSRIEVRKNPPRSSRADEAGSDYRSPSPRLCARALD